jgi:hypothetical protein
VCIGARESRPWCDDSGRLGDASWVRKASRTAVRAQAGVVDTHVGRAVGAEKLEQLDVRCRRMLRKKRKWLQRFAARDDDIAPRPCNHHPHGPIQEFVGSGANFLQNFPNLSCQDRHNRLLYEFCAER